MTHVRDIYVLTWFENGFEPLFLKDFPKFKGNKGILKGLIGSFGFQRFPRPFKLIITKSARGEQSIRVLQKFETSPKNI